MQIKGYEVEFFHLLKEKRHFYPWNQPDIYLATVRVKGFDWEYGVHYVSGYAKDAEMVLTQEAKIFLADKS